MLNHTKLRRARFSYETQTIEEAYPYIDEIFVSYGQPKRDALAELMQHKVDGFIDVDANQDAGGDYLYLYATEDENAKIENSFLHNLVRSAFSAPTFGIIIMSIAALSAIIIFAGFVKKKKKQS